MDDVPTTPPEPRPDAAPRVKRPVPERSADFDHLALDELRSYRNELTDEETRISYWRRVLHARLDVVRGGTPVRLQQGALARILSADTLQAGRTSLVRVVPGAGLPPLPDLGALWQLHPVRGDSAAGDAARLLGPSGQPAITDDILARLEAAERQVSAYRRSVHVRIDEATAELIARYRERPALAVRALPLTPPMRARLARY